MDTPKFKILKNTLAAILQAMLVLGLKVRYWSLLLSVSQPKVAAYRMSSHQVN